MAQTGVAECAFTKAGMDGNYGLMFDNVTGELKIIKVIDDKWRVESVIDKDGVHPGDSAWIPIAEYGQSGEVAFASPAWTNKADEPAFYRVVDGELQLLGTAEVVPGETPTQEVLVMPGGLGPAVDLTVEVPVLDTNPSAEDMLFLLMKLQSINTIAENLSETLRELRLASLRAVV